MKLKHKFKVGDSVRFMKRDGKRGIVFALRRGGNLTYPYRVKWLDSGNTGIYNDYELYHMIGEEFSDDELFDLVKSR